MEQPPDIQVGEGTDTRTGAEIAEERIADFKRRMNAQLVGTFEILDLQGLSLETVPESLRGLRYQGIVHLGRNQLDELPEWIGEVAQNLIVSSNNLKVLPNGIGTISLQGLAAHNNALESLPKSLLDSSNLHTLLLQGNPLGIPAGILASRSPAEILAYYFESRGEKGRPLLELKLLLVGRGKAGKTTLVKQLAKERPSARESETHSIAIRELGLRCPRGSVRTRAWDFGGQEILHSTHQFFLTERSLYLLVLEPRTGLAQRDAEYWLKLIETQGGGSPVIVVMNHSHGRRWPIDQVKLRRLFPFIVDFIWTDALHGDGIDALRNTILQTVEERMPDVWLPFPVRWRAIKDRVAGMDENFLTYDDYVKICVEYGEDDPDKQADLAGILHALGLALYFGNDPRLHDHRVLNPSWVTGGVYAVIRSESVREKDGQLTAADMPRVLREAQKQKVVKAKDYPPETHPFILELMRAFQLCFAHEPEGEPGGADRPVRYLVPELLPEFEPEMVEAWDQAPVRLRYTYEVLPPGLLPRFIVRTHPLSEDAPHWRHGVVLRHGDASALIRAESDRPQLEVFVLGGDEDTRRVLVTMVRRELEALHGEMKMAPVETLELTGEGDRWISVKSLREMEEASEPTKRMPILPEGTAEVNIPLELDKLDPPESRAIDRDPTVAPAPVRVFVSYAHADERALKRLDAILGVLEQQHGLVAWRDERLISGDEWDEEIRRRLEEMDIFLFIASQRSIVSSYIRDTEIQRAQERREKGEVEIVTVKLEACAVDEDSYLGKLQRLARGFPSIAKATPRSEGWEQVRKDLLPVIKRVSERKKAAGERQA
ncbi:COR domain-containing protein [Longimicrobium sp.]|uniref:COR domain-containing protein n=1 Tax=Longimicrobium sp. TaxID=2029185 RepID=UPI003B3AD2C1